MDRESMAPDTRWWHVSLCIQRGPLSHTQAYRGGEQLVVNDERRLPAGRVLIQGVVLRTPRTT